jgi:drug/metabolite transporter (DMT)-like permease
MEGTIQYLGQALSLLAAVVWGIAVILFKKSGETVHPVALNLFKTLLAAILFLPTMWIFGEPLFRQVPRGNYLLFLASGVIGLGIGDTLFFKSLNRIGAGLSAIVAAMYSPSIITLSIIYLDERLTLVQLIGTLLIITAVLTTTRLKHGEKIGRRDLLLGILWGILSTTATAIGVVMIKPTLEHTPLLWAIEVRLFGGVVSLTFVALFHPLGKKMFSPIFSARTWGYTVSSSFLGAYLTMFVWLGGMKFTQASIASALNQTSIVFVFLFGTIFLHEPITTRRTLAIILAVCGVFLIFFG